MIVFVLFADLYLNYNHRIITVNQNELLEKTNYEQIFSENKGYDRVNIPFELIPMRALYFKYYCTNGDSTIVTKNFFDYMHTMANLPIPKQRRNTLNSNFFETDKAFSSKIIGIKYAVIKKHDGYQLLEMPQVLPRAFLVEKAIFLPDIEAHIDSIKHQSFNPKKQVLLLDSEKEYAHRLSRIVNDSSEVGSVKITSYQPESIQLNSESKINSYLVLCDN